MDIHEAEMERAELATRLRQGQITMDGYTAAIDALRFTDFGGRVWQPDPSGDGWIFWNGSAWQPGAPPGMSGPGMTTGEPPPRAKGFNEFKSSLMTVDEFKKMSKDVPLAKRPQRWWDLLSILGGIAGAILWFIYGSIRSSQEGFDLITPVLMIAIPIILVWFRADIDEMLQPLQPTRKKISRILLIGLGIATPFLTAWILYNIFSISQYPLMQANIIVGTLAAYVITRDPAPVSGKPGSGRAVAGAVMIICTIILCSLIMAPVLADDCTRDPLNAQDCLRTSGYAEVMAGIIAAILSILVNGPIIIQSILEGTVGADSGISGPAAPPATASAGAVTGAQTPASTTDPAVQDWLDSRTVYPGTWHVSPDGTSISVDGYPGYDIPVSWVTGTSQNPIENTIFNTPIPGDDHADIADNVTDDLIDADSDAFEKFTNYTWHRMDDAGREDAISDLVKTIGKNLGEPNVTVVFDPNMKFDPTPAYPNGQPMDAVSDFGNHVIRINPNSTYWNDPGKMIEIVGHEMKHQQQWDPANPMENQTARDAATTNRDNYHKYETDPSKYAGQYVENDANSFGQNVRTDVRTEAANEEEKKLFDFFHDLKDATPSTPETPKLTIDDIKKNPQGFIDHLNKNPAERSKFFEILKRNKIAGVR